MTATAAEPIVTRGRPPAVSTLDGRLEELEQALQKNKIGNRKLSELNEGALVMEHHYAGYLEKGEDVGAQLKRVQKALRQIASRVQLPSDNGTKKVEAKPSPVGTSGQDPLAEVRRIRDQIQELRQMEESLYAEVGRKAVEETLGIAS